MFIVLKYKYVLTPPIIECKKTNMAEDKIGSLEEEALKRKERLQALKKKTEENKENKSESASKLPK